MVLRLAGLQVNWPSCPIGRDPSAVETTHDLASAKAVRLKLRQCTLCRHGSSLLD